MNRTARRRVTRDRTNNRQLLLRCQYKSSFCSRTGFRVGSFSGRRRRARLLRVIPRLRCRRPTASPSAWGHHPAGAQELAHRNGLHASVAAALRLPVLEACGTRTPKGRCVPRLTERHSHSELQTINFVIKIYLQLIIS